MALVTPIALTKNAFDATQQEEFRFNVVGGDQVVKNRITIKDNETDEIVYQNISETYSFSQIVPPNTLENGKYYNFYFNTYSIDENISANSNIVQFYCYNAPSLEISNLPSSRIIQTASFNFEIMYNQEQGELLNNVVVSLYNSNQVLIQQSPVLYGADSLPTMLYWLCQGLVDGESYYIKASGNTVNGTVVETDMLSFSIKYDYEEYDFEAVVTNKCEDGYVGVKSNISVIGGTSNKPLNFSQDGLILERGAYVIWSNIGFNSNKFTLRKWWKGVYHGLCDTYYGDTLSDRYEIHLERVKLNGEFKDFISLRGYRNGRQWLYKRSNLVDALNCTCYCMTYFRVDGDTITFSLEVLDREETVILLVSTKTGQANVQTNRLTDIYDNKPISDGSLPTEYQLPTTKFEIMNCKLENCVVRHLDITNEVTSEYSALIPTEWTDHTIFDCTFENTLSAGKYKWTLMDVDRIKIKRRKANELTWVTIYEKLLEAESDLRFTFRDYMCPSGIEYEWALVPCLRENELSYFTAQTKTKFNALFVSDGTRTMRLEGNLTYDGNTVNQLIGMLQPYNAKYPTIITNPNVLYETLGVSGTILYRANDDLKQVVMDRYKMHQLRDEWIGFLCNGLPKIVKDINGKIILGRITTPPSFSYASNDANGVINMSFGITEQGKYDNQQDLINNYIVKELD